MIQLASTVRSTFSRAKSRTGAAGRSGPPGRYRAVFFS
jgi:hypothetical protein